MYLRRATSRRMRSSLAVIGRGPFQRFFPLSLMTVLPFRVWVYRPVYFLELSLHEPSLLGVYKEGMQIIPGPVLGEFLPEFRKARVDRFKYLEFIFGIVVGAVVVVKGFLTIFGY